MTKEEWAAVEKALSGTYGSAKIKADEFEVTFYRTLVSENRLGILTYVNGVYRGEWFLADSAHPEQRCLRPASRYLCRPKERARLKKLSKPMRKTLGPAFDPDRRWHYFDACWPNATAIRRHYQKTFQTLELMEVLG